MLSSPDCRENSFAKVLSFGKAIETKSRNMETKKAQTFRS